MAENTGTGGAATAPQPFFSDGQKAGLSAGLGLFGLSMDVKAAAQRQKEQNEVIRGYNKQLLKKSADDISALNVQRALSRMRTAQALFSIESQALQERSGKRTSLAATDTVGASARASLNAVDVAASTAYGGVRLNQELTEESLDSNIRTTATSAQNSVKSLLYGAESRASWEGLSGMVQSAAQAFM